MSDDRKQRHPEASAVQPYLEPDMFRLAIEAAPNPMLVVGEDGAIVMVNDAASDLFGYEPAELMGKPVEILVPAGLRGVHRKHRDKFAESPESRRMGGLRDLQALKRDGTEIPVEVGLSPIRTPSGLMVVGSFMDLTARKETEEELQAATLRLGRENQQLVEMVATDGLTSLKSRKAFMEHLVSHLEISVRNARPLSVLILDIDHFKAYNDDFGHLGGDEVLRQVGRVLLDVARRSDLVARLGGEEFGVILPETDKKGAIVLGERFREAIEADEWPRRAVTVSIGGTTFEFEQTVPRPQAPDLSLVLTKADQALYHSKAEGRNRMTHESDMDGNGRP